jgi:hypothetical protein
MPNDAQPTNHEHDVDRWTLIRDIAVLQFKLVVDGLRDLILVPVSLVVGIISVVKGGDETNNDFYELLQLGRKSERWINLFGAAERVHGKTDDEVLPVNDIDDMVTRVESFIVEEYKSGGVTRQAKARLDKAIDVLHKSVRKSKTDADQ